MYSQTEENYLKAIFKLSEKTKGYVTTNEVSASMNTTAASVTDMLKRLAEKKLIKYARYKGVQLSKDGRKVATNLIRKHRLWESFLVEKLNFEWDEVHDIAEQLEHIKSKALTEKLDKFLGYPKFDPHGDPIPDSDGVFAERSSVLLKDLNVDEKGLIVGVRDSDDKFLKYLDSVNLVLGTEIRVKEHFEFDDSLQILANGKKELSISSQVSNNLYVQKKK